MDEKLPKNKKGKKKGILKKIFLFFIMFILLIVAIFFIRNIIRNYKNKKFITNLYETQQEEVMNVLVEINPSFLFVVKKDSIIDSHCLNDDCNDLLNKIGSEKDNIINQKLDKIIENIYDNAKKYGYDTSNGIKVSSSNMQVQKLVSKIDDVSFKYITQESEKEIINEIKDKVLDIDKTKNDYNQMLLEKLKKDSDYDKTYSCIIDNGEVKCYMKDFMKELLDEFGSESLVGKIGEITIAYDRFVNLLKKFDIEYSFIYVDGEPDKTITLNDGITYGYGDMASCDITDCNNNVLDRVSARYVLMPNEEDEKKLTGLEDTITYIPFTKVNLLTKTYEKKDIIVIDRTDECNKKVYYGIG